MAGGEVPLGIFEKCPTDDTQLVAIVKQAMTARLVAVLNLTTETTTQKNAGTEDE